ncbi:MAG: M1 family metallopeptidase [Anaerolineae bacterium]
MTTSNQTWKERGARLAAGLMFASLLLLLAGCTLFNRPKPDPWAAYRAGLAPLSQNILDSRSDWPRYSLDLQIDPETRTIQGSQEVIITNDTQFTWGDLYFRLFPNLPHFDGEMEIASVQRAGRPLPFSYAADRTAIRVAPPQPVAPGASLTLDLIFSVEAPAPTESYVLFGASQGILNLPLAYPVLAVFDQAAAAASEPIPWRLDMPATYGDTAFTQAALYQVTATLPSTFTVVATGVLLGRTSSADGQDTWRWTSGPIREWMMTLSPDFHVVSTSAYSTTVNSYFLSGDEATGNEALQIAAAALRVYQDHYGRYPYPAMDIVASPLQYRGMEFPGLDLIGLGLYRQRTQDLEFLIVHEVAHQWWYNMVGNDPVRTPWLDEGLAEYSTYVYLEAVRGQAAADNLLANRWQTPVTYARNNGLDAVVNQPASAFGPGRYETIVYAKAALFFHAVRQEVGDDMFFRILKAYVQRYRFREVQPADFVSLAERLSGKSLAAIYNEWVLSYVTP